MNEKKTFAGYKLPKEYVWGELEGGIKTVFDIQEMFTTTDETNKAISDNTVLNKKTMGEGFTTQVKEYVEKLMTEIKKNDNEFIHTYLVDQLLKLAKGETTPFHQSQLEVLLNFDENNLGEYVRSEITFDDNEQLTTTLNDILLEFADSLILYNQRLETVETIEEFGFDTEPFDYDLPTVDTSPSLDKLLNLETFEVRISTNLDWEEINSDKKLFKAIQNDLVNVVEINQGDFYSEHWNERNGLVDGEDCD